ncbi:MAG: hypothetical protein Q8K66_13905 [Sediminibacterium sp.]|nr:hypothetical protein [Sediminibacterium sp.]MDP3129281.1 hypothetical protein [Sediminibacterium sp.]
MHKLSISILSIAIVIINGCNSDSKSGQHTKGNIPTKDTSSEYVSASKANYNIYIENSASMDGYVKQPSDFKNGLYKLIGDIHNYNLSEKLLLNFINDTICPQKVNAPTPDIIYFIENLKPTDFKNSGCEVKNSFLPNIISKAVSANPKDVNILISDCIFSSQKGSSKDFLSAAKESMRTFIKTELDRNDISCVILKMNSQFYGTYFIENKSITKKTEILNGQKRPYYIILFGNSSSVNYLLQKIKFSNYPGFETSYYLLTPNANKPNSKIIRTNKIGDFEIEQPATKLTINDAKAGGKNSNENQFQFSVASNLEFLKMDETYLSNTANYEVPSNYNLITISKNDDNTNESLKGFTHVFTVRTLDLKQNQEVFIKLKSKLPPWVDSSSTEDDSNPLDPVQQKKTFGFKYLIEGISAAYADKYEGKEQFGINVKVSSNNYDKHGSSSKFPWLLLLLIGCIIGALLFFKNKKS